MKTIIACLILFLFVACTGSSEKKEVPKTQPSPAKYNNQNPGSQTTQHHKIVEENDRCICTKEWAPVCGENGQMYPNSCQAECEGIKNFTKGLCPKKN